MIISIHESHDPFLIKERVRAPAEIGGEFGRINLLMFSSVELREKFGLSLSVHDFDTPFQLAPALTNSGQRPTDSPVRKSRVARLVAMRPSLLPCFVAYQETPQGTFLPLMSDCQESHWSLFFGLDGAMTLVEYSDGQWRITPEAELLPQGTEDPPKGTRSFLLNGLRSAKKKILMRAGDTDAD